MPNGYTYASYQQAVVTQIPTTLNDSNFQTMLPNSIDYAELSLYRDLDFLALHGNVSVTVAPGVPIIALPSGVIVVEEIYYTTTNSPDNIYQLDGFGNPILDGFGNKIVLFQSTGEPVSPMSQAAIRAIYSSAPPGPPRYFSIIGGASESTWTPSMQILFGPTPDTGYIINAYATQRQAPLSVNNPVTFISQELPDVFWAAAMIFWSSYLKNFGSMADQPQMSVSWEQEYQRLLKGANTEEMRKKFQSQGWQAQQPAPLAMQQRG